jgi:hypothetical protein
LIYNIGYGDKMAKKYYIILFLVLSALSCTGGKDFINGERVSENGKAFILWNEKRYVFLGPFTSSLRGKQVGIIDNNPKDKIHAVKGYDSEEWLINYLDVIMTTYSLWKEENVEIIPEEFEKYR